VEYCTSNKSVYFAWESIFLLPEKFIYFAWENTLPLDDKKAVHHLTLSENCFIGKIRNNLPFKAFEVS